ncbi:MAG: hypothetical protein ACXWP6_19935 [Ktedonobacterales bacterium]
MKRPFGVTLVGVLQLVQGLLLVGLAAAVIFLNATLGRGRLGQALVINLAGLTLTGVLSAVLVGALGIFIMLSGIGVLRLVSWAWLAAMALQGWTLALFLFSYFIRGQSNYSTYPSVILSVIIVFYLNSRTVRRTFDRVRRNETASEAEPPAITHAGMTTEAEVTSRSSGMS